MPNNRTIWEIPLIGRWQWDWNELCGADGLIIWSPIYHDLGLCFQALCLQIPFYSALALISAYYFGRQIDYVSRGRRQLIAIHFRLIIVLLLTLFPLLKMYIALNENDKQIETIFYLFCVIEAIGWFIHLGYNIGLRKRLGLSSRGPVSVCVIWTIIAVLSAISLRTHYLIYKHDPNTNKSIYYSYDFSIINVILQILYGLTLIPNTGDTVYVEISRRFVQNRERQPLLSNAYQRFMEEHDPNYLGVAMEDSTWLSKLLFHWVNPLMQKGYEGKIGHTDDLHDLPLQLTSTYQSRKFNKALQTDADTIQRALRETYDHDDGTNEVTSENVPEVTYKIYSENANILRALHKCFWMSFYGIGILKFIGDCSAFAGPILLNKLVSFIENKSDDIKLGYAYSFGLFITTLLGAFCNSHFNFQISIVGLKMRSALITTIYKKILTVGGTTLNSTLSVGEIVNFMSTDMDRIVNSCPSFHALWSIPFQIIIALYLLYRQVGLAFLAGVAFTIVLIPINKYIANKIGQLSTKMMEHKDSRVKMMMELLRGIKCIKLYVWEGFFIKLISKMRDKELRYLKGRKYLDALCVYFWATTPVLISILTFGTYVLLGNKLTAATVFTSMALLNMLIAPLNAFPWVLNGLTEAWVSIKRIQRLIDLPDLELDLYYESELLNEEPNTELLIKDGTFNWGKMLTKKEKELLHLHRRQINKGKGKRMPSSPLRSSTSNSGDGAGETSVEIKDDPSIFNLTDVNLIVEKGEFLGVIGTVGCGKSTLLAAVLAEVNKISGRIAIADIKKGFGFVTQQPWLQRGTIRENILFGKSYDEAKYKSVINACCLADDLVLLPAGDLTGVGEGGTTLSGGQKARIALARAIYQDKSFYLLDDIIAAVDANVAKHIFQNCIMGLLKNKTRILCTHHIQYLINADRIILMENGRIKSEGKPALVLKGIDDIIPIDIELGDSMQSGGTTFLDSIISEDVTQETDSILNEESRDIGTVDTSVYLFYLKSIGILLFISILISIVLMQASRNMTDWWLSYWVSNTQRNNTINGSSIYVEQPFLSVTTASHLIMPERYTIQYYMLIYVLLTLANTIFTLFRAFLFAFGGLTAASRIHRALLKVIMTSKVTFFDISPIGRILNRFSSDTYTIDDSLPFIMNILFAQLFGLIGCVIVIMSILPWLCSILIPLIPIYHWLQNHYRLTSRELKRLSSVTLSPVYNHFNETLQGLATIKAFRSTSRFIRENEEYVETNLKTQFASQAAAQWLGLRLQFIGVAVVTGVGVIAIIQHQYDVVDPGLVGLAITYSLSLTGLLNGVINAFTETEREMIAVERVNQYIEEIVPENKDFFMAPPYAWPTQGVITFTNVVLKYRDHLAPALKGISFESRPAEKIGVVGRTGAGKSSLVAGLFRIAELYNGEISIDSVNIGHISLAALRSRLFCIPQEPFLFSGTIKDNLDPLGEFREPELWSALSRVDLTPTIKRLGGLNYEINSGGNNLSVGQRQLFCLARALLHNAKILCIDEATANVDHGTDHQIQLVLRSAFRKSTVIVIAHRVQTVLDCDRILVMGDGQILEFDSPDILLADSSSTFYNLVNTE